MNLLADGYQVAIRKDLKTKNRLILKDFAAGFGIDFAAATQEH